MFSGVWFYIRLYNVEKTPDAAVSPGSTSKKVIHGMKHISYPFIPKSLWLLFANSSYPGINWLFIKNIESSKLIVEGVDWNLS